MQLQQEIIPLQQLAHVLSFTELTTLVNGAALVCKRWHAVIASQALAWTTAIQDLDPCAVLGPACILRAAQTLKRSGGWLQLAKRLAAPVCAHRSCGIRTGCFDLTTTRHACPEHRSTEAQHRVVINDFTLDKSPCFTVHTAQQLKEALDAADFGDCIQIAGHVIWDFATLGSLMITGVRLVGADTAPLSASLTVPASSITVGNAICEHLQLIVGRPEGGATHFAGVIAYQERGVDPVSSSLLHNCQVHNYQVSV